NLAVALLWAIVGTAVSLMMPLASAKLIEVLLMPATAFDALGRAASVLMVLYVIEPIATFLYVERMSRVSEAVLFRLKTSAFEAVLAQEIAELDRRGSAAVIAAVTADAASVKGAVMSNLSRDRGVRAVLESIFGLIILAVLAPKLAWIFGIVIPVAATALANARKALGRRVAAESTLLAVEAATAGEAVRNVREVRSFGAEARELRRFSRAAAATAEVAAAVGCGAGRLEALNRGAIYTSILGVLWYGGRLVARGSMHPPLLVSLIGFCF
ncbi:unnamed protein product, partial [Phaeothamnion confervicola]